MDAAPVALISNALALYTALRTTMMTLEDGDRDDGFPNTMMKATCKQVK